MRSFSDNREITREEGVRTPTPAGYATITSTGRDYRSTTPDERYPAARHVSFYEVAWPSEVNNESKPRQKTDTDYFSGPSQGFAAVDSYFRQPRQDQKGSLSPATQSTHNYLTPSETLDDVDIESLIASYKPMMHPTASAAVLERGAALVSARREKQHFYQRQSTQEQNHRRTLSHDETSHTFSTSSVSSLSSPASGSSRPANMRRTSSSTSHVERSFSHASQSSVSTSASSTSFPMSPAASKSQGGSPTSSRKSSYLSLFRRTSKSNSVSRSPKESLVLDRATLPATKEGEEASSARPPSSTSVQRAYSLGPPSATFDTMPCESSGRRRSSSSAFVTGSVAQAPSLSRTQSSSTTSTSSTSHRAPIPSRFTYSAAVSDGLGSLYSSRSLHVPPAASKTDPNRSDSTIESPRSSVSSRSHASLRWSSGSARTASTSQSSQPACVNGMSASDAKPKENPAAPLPSTNGVGQDSSHSAARSWLSLDDDDSDLEIAPPLQRKNSLWRESLDSVASSKLELEDSIKATDFPQPPAADIPTSVALEKVPAASATEQPKPAGSHAAEDATKSAPASGSVEQKPAAVLTSAIMVNRSMSDSVVTRVPSVHRSKPGSGDVRLPVHSISPLRRVGPPQAMAASVSSTENLDTICDLDSLNTLRPALQRSASTKTKHVRYAL